MIKKLLFVVTLLYSILSQAEINQLELIGGCYNIENNNSRWFCMALVNNEIKFCDLIDNKSSQNFCKEMYKKKLP